MPNYTLYKMAIPDFKGPQNFVKAQKNVNESNSWFESLSHDFIRNIPDSFWVMSWSESKLCNKSKYSGSFLSREWVLSRDSNIRNPFWVVSWFESILGKSLWVMSWVESKLSVTELNRIKMSRIHVCTLTHTYPIAFMFYPMFSARPRSSSLT